MNGEQPWFGIAWWVWALGCAAVAAVYIVVEEPAAGPGLSGWWLRWGHSLCWVLLAMSFVLRMTPWSSAAPVVAAAGGLSYGAYLFLKFTTPSP